MTHTLWPSVTGEGDDMFCLRSRWSPLPRCFFQIGTPLPLSIDHSQMSFPSATLRKMRSPQMIGVDPDRAGSDRRHAMFSVFVHLIGRLISRLMPLPLGPRQAGQFSAFACGVPPHRRTVKLRTTGKREFFRSTVKFGACLKSVMVDLSPPAQTARSWN